MLGEADYQLLLIMYYNNYNNYIKKGENKVKKLATLSYLLGLAELAYATCLLIKGSGWAAFWFIMGLSDLKSSKKNGFLNKEETINKEENNEH